MSYAVMIMKFEKGDPAALDLQELEQIIKPIGQLTEGQFGMEIQCEGDYMFEYASMMGEGVAEHSGIIFNRPKLEDRLIQLIYDILSLENTCFFDQEMEFTISRNIEIDNLPASIIENTENASFRIESVDELKEFINKMGF